MVLQDAFEAAQRFLDGGIRVKHNVEIVINKCEEMADNWAFYYDSRRFIEQGDILFALAGNGPIIVPKSGAEPYIGPIFRAE